GGRRGGHTGGRRGAHFSNTPRVKFDILWASMPFFRRLSRWQDQTMILLTFLFSTVMASPQERRPIIAIGGIMHESDTFNPAKTGLSDFTRRRTTPREA